MDKQSQSRAPLIIAIVLLLLPVLYVWSYLALVVPEGRIVRKITKEFRTGRVLRFYYRIDSDTLLPCIFWPLEQIDRKVRPGHWLRRDIHQATQATKTTRFRTNSLEP